MEIPTGLLRWTNRIDVAAARRFGWSLGSRALGVPVAVLHTTGAKTGKARTSIVTWAPGHPGDGDEAGTSGQIVVGGGAGGRRQVPDWVANLRAHAELRVTIDTRTYQAIAREPSGSERETAKNRLLAVWPRAAAYEHQSGRPLPIFVIDRAEQ